MKDNNILREKSKAFAIRIIDLSKMLADKREFVLPKQILRSGTSIGANLVEAKYAVSKKDFALKISISLKECAETEYWLDILKATDFISKQEYDRLIADCKDILYMLIAASKTLKTINDKG
jgi:four helix bundle protein